MKCTKKYEEVMCPNQLLRVDWYMVHCALPNKLLCTQKYQVIKTMTFRKPSADQIAAENIKKALHANEVARLTFIF